MKHKNDAIAEAVQGKTRGKNGVSLVLTFDTADAGRGATQLPQDFAKFFSNTCQVKFAARAMPTRSIDKRLRKYANLAAAAALLEFELCSYVAFGLLKRTRLRTSCGAAGN